jgi:hypothetical protein
MFILILVLVVNYILSLENVSSLVMEMRPLVISFKMIKTGRSLEVGM